MNRNLVLLSIILLAGCTPQEPQYTWVKSSSAGNDKEYIIADSACTAEAYKAAPTTTDASCADARGFAKGFCRGTNAGRSKEAQSVRTKVYDGCMLGKGWEKRSSQ